MKVAIGADHAGYRLKDVLAARLADLGHAITDLGTHSEDPVDYPDYAAAVGKAVVDGRAERGIIICGSGAGAAIAANKLRGVRCALSHDTYTAHQSVEHDDVNVNCILPGTIDTPQNRESMPDADFSTWVPPAALADVVLFLASPAARAVNGAAVPVYGRS